jgi:hypothetical protein
MKTRRIVVVLVLWDRLCDKGNKVTHWPNLEDACAYIEKIEPGLKTRVYNGELHWEEGYNELATARVKIVDD